MEAACRREAMVYSYIDAVAQHCGGLVAYRTGERSSSHRLRCIFQSKRHQALPGRNCGAGLRLPRCMVIFHGAARPPIALSGRHRQPGNRYLLHTGSCCSRDAPASRRGLALGAMAAVFEHCDTRSSFSEKRAATMVGDKSVRACSARF